MVSCKKITCIYCIGTQAGQAGRDVTNNKSRVNETAEPLKLTHRTPGIRSNPGEEPLC